mmetsp:Transcript_29088/g.60441  ORF Transcript_29088/g.60441 Transcript_29088/m.60441 type:complete len:376 (-) Transcript_29088:898-2025(-)
MRDLQPLPLPRRTPPCPARHRETNPLLSVQDQAETPLVVLRALSDPAVLFGTRRVDVGRSQPRVPALPRRRPGHLQDLVGDDGRQRDRGRFPRQAAGRCSGQPELPIDGALGAPQDHCGGEGTLRPDLQLLPVQLCRADDRAHAEQGPPADPDREESEEQEELTGKRGILRAEPRGRLLHALPVYPRGIRSGGTETAEGMPPRLGSLGDLQQVAPRCGLQAGGRPPKREATEGQPERDGGFGGAPAPDRSGRDLLRQPGEQDRLPAAMERDANGEPAEGPPQRKPPPDTGPDRAIPLCLPAGMVVPEFPKREGNPHRWWRITEQEQHGHHLCLHGAPERSRHDARPDGPAGPAQARWFRSGSGRGCLQRRWTPRI